MPTEYSLHNGLTRTVDELIADASLEAGTGRNLGLLRDHEIRVTPVMSTREGDGEVKKAKKPIKVRKVSDMDKALSPNLGDFLLVVDSGCYDGASEHQQRMMLYDALMLIDVSVSDNGSVKTSIRQPDLVINSETIRLFGLCDNTTLMMADSVSYARKHKQLFVADAEKPQEDGETKPPSKKRAKIAAPPKEEADIEADQDDPDGDEPSVDKVADADEDATTSKDDDSADAGVDGDEDDDVRPKSAKRRKLRADGQ